MDSLVVGEILKKISWGSIRTAIKDYYDTISTVLTNKYIS
jgi:hypothetical protein